MCDAHVVQHQNVAFLPGEDDLFLLVRLAQLFRDFVVRDRELAVRGDALLAARIALQMRAEGARTRIRNPARERQIAARDRVP